MIPDDIEPVSLWHWVAHAILASYAMLLTWIGRVVFNDVQKLKENSGKCELELSQFKTEVANTYSKEASVQASLGRLHDRIDAGQKTAEENFKELRDDIGEIKNILIGKIRR